MPPRIEKFPTEGLEGAPSRDIGWYFGDPVPNKKGNVVCKLCGKVLKGVITRFKEHIAHKTREVALCPNVTESMMKLLKEAKEKKMDKKRRTNEFLSQLREEDDEFVDDVFAMRQATQESIQSQHEWHRREEFRRSTGGWDNIYEEGRSSSLESRGRYREERSEFSLRGTIPEFVKSKSSRQPKDIGKKSSVAKVLEEAKKVTCFIYNHIWTVDLMKKYTHGKQILRPALTRFATHFIHLEEITRQKQAKRAIKENCRYSIEYERIIDNRWNFMHFDLHSAGYFLNPQFQFGVEHSENVLAETLKGTRSMIERLEPSIDNQIIMVNQLLLFRSKHETFGTPQAQRAWNQMNSEKENPLLDGENAGVLPVDTSDDEMNVDDQSQQQNLSHSSSSTTPSQSDGPDGGGLSPIDDNDRQSGD
ncbi:hypothetical protein F3Y22_tig00117012pilonHSYRG00354 [Hibiscus syriacus]|uniref:BED-type domain-containing protein n=1 Tax=Hibiscus syriacus TaxID=106335 RepID=A0A6A2WJ36_HIBSY|nr:hypothetical protein F3Y22_tig00117012pilonHSYRG00354 [Hibiscus syriacus]